MVALNQKAVTSNPENDVISRDRSHAKTTAASGSFGDRCRAIVVRHYQLLGLLALPFSFTPRSAFGADTSNTQTQTQLLVNDLLNQRTDWEKKRKLFANENAALEECEFQIARIEHALGELPDSIFKRASLSRDLARDAFEELAKNGSARNLLAYGETCFSPRQAGESFEKALRSDPSNLRATMHVIEYQHQLIVDDIDHRGSDPVLRYTKIEELCEGLPDQATLSGNPAQIGNEIAIGNELQRVNPKLDAAKYKAMAVLALAGLGESDADFKLRTKAVFELNLLLEQRPDDYGLHFLEAALKFSMWRSYAALQDPDIFDDIIEHCAYLEHQEQLLSDVETHCMIGLEILRQVDRQTYDLLSGKFDPNTRRINKDFNWLSADADPSGQGPNQARCAYLAGIFFSDATFGSGALFGLNFRLRYDSFNQLLDNPSALLAMSVGPGFSLLTEYPFDENDPWSASNGTIENRPVDNQQHKSHLAVHKVVGSLRTRKFILPNGHIIAVELTGSKEDPRPVIDYLVAQETHFGASIPEPTKIRGMRATARVVQAAEGRAEGQTLLGEPQIEVAVLLPAGLALERCVLQATATSHRNGEGGPPVLLSQSRADGLALATGCIAKIVAGVQERQSPRFASGWLLNTL